MLSGKETKRAAKLVLFHWLGIPKAVLPWEGTSEEPTKAIHSDTKQIKRQITSPVVRGELVPKVATVYYLKCSVSKHNETCKETGKYYPTGQNSQQKLLMNTTETAQI